MSSITTQQTKLDLELVPKEKRLKIRKCNGRLNPGKKHREPIFQVVMDALALTLCYSAFLTTADVPKICLRVHGQNFDEPPTDEVIVSFFKELGHTRKSSQSSMLLLIRCINLGELLLLSSTEVYLERQPVLTSFVDNRARLPESMTSLEIRETKAYKTYLCYAKGVTPPMNAQKFKKPASPKLTTVPVSPEEPTRKSKRYEEVHKKSLRDFHKTHPSGSGIVTKIAPSAAKIKPSVSNKGTGAKQGVPNVTGEESTKSEAESWGRDKDDSNNDHDSSSEGSDQDSDSVDDNTQSDKGKGSDFVHETDENETDSKSNQEENEEEVEDDEEEKDDKFVKTPSNYTDDEDETNVESKVEYNAEGNGDKGMDCTTNQFDDDVDVRLNEPVYTDEGLIQNEGTDAKMINVKQGNENLEITLNQVIEDAYVTISTVIKKTEVLVTSSSYSSDLASKFLKFSDIPYTDA
ncbi:hypothetical protein Tco_1424592 [Tanacetum coccineum]